MGWLHLWTRRVPVAARQALPFSIPTSQSQRDRFHKALRILTKRNEDDLFFG